MRWFDRRKRRGNQAIEFALVVPVLTAITSGVMDYGWYFVQEHQTLSAVRDAARIAATYPVTSDPAAIAEKKANEFLDSMQVTGERKVVATIVGDPGELRVHLDVTAAYGSLMGIVPSPKRLHSSIEMFLEEQPRATTLSLSSTTGSTIY